MGSMISDVASAIWDPVSSLVTGIGEAIGLIEETPPPQYNYSAAAAATTPSVPTKATAAQSVAAREETAAAAGTSTPQPSRPTGLGSVSTLLTGAGGLSDTELITLKRMLLGE
jgi:hypothetical protein